MHVCTLTLFFVHRFLTITQDGLDRSTTCVLCIFLPSISVNICVTYARGGYLMPFCYVPVCTSVSLVKPAALSRKAEV